MSSPTILTAVVTSFQDAYGSNQESVAHYLELAKEIYDQAMSLQRDAAALGGKFAPLSILPYEEAEAKANALLHNGQTAGYEGVEYAHAYWQSLKHPWFDQVVRRHGEFRALEHRRNQAELARLAEVSARASAVLGVRVDVDRITVSAPAGPRDEGWGVKIAVSLEAIMRTLDAEGVSALSEAIERSASLHPQERFLALETLRLRLEQEVKQRRRDLAIRLYEESRQRLAEERIQARLGLCQRRMEAMEAEMSPALESEWQALSALAGSGQATDAIEDRTEAFDRQLAQHARQQGLLEAAVTALRQQGYETVQIMQTIGPPEIASVYLQDPRDEGRVALLQVAGERGVLAAETVRREKSNGSRQQKQLDQEAQARLCKAMEAVDQALSTKWKCTAAKQAAPGSVEPKSRQDLPARGRRIRVAASLRTKSIG